MKKWGYGKGNRTQQCNSRKSTNKTKRRARKMASIYTRDNSEENTISHTYHTVSLLRGYCGKQYSVYISAYFALPYSISTIDHISFTILYFPRSTTYSPPTRIAARPSRRYPLSARLGSSPRGTSTADSGPPRCACSSPAA
jgi:hypothetical protein